MTIWRGEMEIFQIVPNTSIKTLSSIWIGTIMILRRQDCPPGDETHSLLDWPTWENFFASFLEPIFYRNILENMEMFRIEPSIANVGNLPWTIEMAVISFFSFSQRKKRILIFLGFLTPRCVIYWSPRPDIHSIPRLACCCQSYIVCWIPLASAPPRTQRGWAPSPESTIPVGHVCPHWRRHRQGNDHALHGESAAPTCFPLPRCMHAQQFLPVSYGGAFARHPLRPRRRHTTWATTTTSACLCVCDRVSYTLALPVPTCYCLQCLCLLVVLV